MDHSDLHEQLRRLAEQHRAGTLSDAEYAAAKGAALGDPNSPSAQETLAFRAVDEPEPATTSRRGFGMLLAAVGLVVLVLAAVLWLWPR